ncbi:sensor histidine kinase [Neomoorella thermoacetica]|uniref:histidine kinase n=1 Tax=Moorella thermoacetica Y72 TaxID=1325331 RepID=A0A0S6UF87_NEOTH|nr:HAMP domain-containing sensor histidine kinase [Moorella thermoacetica]OIQ12785.1 putative sensor histidine kinase TcrY [Moorella thermoacetica]OIQ61665.1 putative sensor histidine kinase TcrY [Moorella thermoacetica]GAF26877.1 signal transduction histidine kinase [Moorella thermoacetica Y72]
MTLRLRLTLLVTITLGLTFIVLGGLVYFLMGHYLTNEIDRSLVARAQEVVRSFRVEGNLRLQRITLPNVNVFSAPDTFIQIVDINGFVVTRSDNLGQQSLPLGPQTLIQAGEGIAFFETEIVGNHPLRLYNVPLLLQNQPVGLLQVARLLSPVQQTLGNLRRVLLFLGLLLIFLAATLGYILARTALRPIDRLTQVAEQIGEGKDLDQRVPYQGPMDEVGRLAATFNAMLARLQRAYTRLEEAYSAQRRFVADASHELRTPLTTIRGNVDLLRKVQGQGEAWQDEALADIASEAERMSRLVNDLLTLARADAGQEIKREPLEILPLLQEVARQAPLLGTATFTAIGLENLAGVHIMGNRDYLKQLFFILLDNAFKYTSSEGKIDLIVNVEPQQRLIIKVRDTGPGIPPRDLEHIFERFYRADATRSSEGTGLGLAIARWIVEQHQGHIGVESTVGKGTTFTVTIPLLKG